MQPRSTPKKCGWVCTPLSFRVDPIRISIVSSDRLPFLTVKETKKQRNKKEKGILWKVFLLRWHKGSGLLQGYNTQHIRTRFRMGMVGRMPITEGRSSTCRWAGSEMFPAKMFQARSVSRLAQVLAANLAFRNLVVCKAACTGTSIRWLTRCRSHCLAKAGKAIRWDR